MAIITDDSPSASEPVGSDRLLTRDNFLSALIGMQVFRLHDPRLADAALALLHGGTDWMIETCMPVDSLDLLALLCGLGFELVDTNVQLDASPGELRLGQPAEGIVVRSADIADREAVERIAVETLVFSRFHRDARIGLDVGRRIKAAWVGNYFDGRRGQRLLVATHAERVGGFLLALESKNVGTIDLIAMEPALRGLGVVGALIHAWLEAAPTMQRFAVGTQLLNTPSLRAYGKLGFRFHKAQHVLHCHGAFRVKKGAK